MKCGTRQLEEKKKIIAITITETVFKKFPCYEDIENKDDNEN